MSLQPSAVSAGRGAYYLGLQYIVSSVGRVFALVFFARLISVEDMGVFTILSLGWSGATAFMSLGLQSIVTKFVAENVAIGNKQTAGDYGSDSKDSLRWAIVTLKKVVGWPL